VCVVLLKLLHVILLCGRSARKNGRATARE
jgi:hypothetical protein